MTTSTRENQTLARFKPDLAMVKQHLDSIAGSEGKALFVCIPESEAAKADPKKKVVTIMLQLDETTIEKLATINGQGFGVFVTVNSTGEKKTRKAADIEKVRALWLDFDNDQADNLAAIKALPLKPHIVVNTSEDKYHAYWLVEDCDINTFKRVMKPLAKKYGADENACDVSRILRVAGLYHQKGKPFLSKLVEV